MKKFLAVLLMVTLATATIGVEQAFASTWKTNPLEHIDKQKKGNVSDHTDAKKKLSPKSYSFKTSKVCGLEICKTDQRPHLQNVLTYGLSTQYDKDFDGKATIKGYFPRK